jgi:hypothetical protein
MPPLSGAVYLKKGTAAMTEAAAIKEGRAAVALLLPE